VKRTSAWGTPVAVVDVTKITPERLRQLTQLCHPDRHNNSPLSNAVFAWLQEVRKELDKRTGQA
jgi:hypothetical protein